MTAITAWRLRSRVLPACLVLAPILLGCAPVRLETEELRPASFATGASGVQGSQGFCLSAGHPPPSPFSPGAGQVMVGFDDFFRAGSGPFPCDDVRAQVFRAGVLFDLSQFDSIVVASLKFDTAASVSRNAGGTSASPPPKSVATRLGVGVEPFSNQMPFDNQAMLPPGPAIDLAVTGQVRDWVTKERPNFGFVISGPRGLVDPGSPPEDNDAEISWYQNFRLAVAYNPALNPRAPQ